MKNDKFLMGILIGIVVMMLVAVGVFFIRQGSQDYMVEDTPDGVVHNFIFAIQQNELDRAYAYLAEGEDKPTFPDFLQQTSNEDLNDYGIQIQDSEIFTEENGDKTATVRLLIIHSNNDPLGSGSRYADSIQLKFQEGSWKITTFPSRFWFWNWGRY